MGLLIRIAGNKWEFVTDRDERKWNAFDSLMLGLTVAELLWQTVEKPGGALNSGRAIRFLKILRITRTVRIGRIIRYARTVQQIVYALQASVGTLFWSMLMVFMVLYCFSIAFVQGATEYLTEFEANDQSDSDVADGFRKSYGCLGTAIYSLFMAMTGGRNWGEVIEPFLRVSWLYSALFILFISITYFGLLNVVTSIFVDSAMKSRQHYKDLLIHDSSRKKERVHQHLRQLFAEMDAGHTGCIDQGDMERVLEDPNLNMYLESMDIFVNDARALFKLLDQDGAGKVSIDAFCDGCLRLKGEAKSYDIHVLLYNAERSRHKLDKIAGQLNDLLHKCS